MSPPQASCLSPRTGICESWPLPARRFACSSSSKNSPTKGRASTVTAPVAGSMSNWRAKDRWPRFTPKAVEAGFRSVQAVPMRLRAQTIGALNLFRVDAGLMPESDVAAAQALADVATIAILQHRAALSAQLLNDQLSRALDSRIVIEQAKGVVSEAAGLDMEEAFARLRRHARVHNLRLADVADGITNRAIPVASLEA